MMDQYGNYVLQYIISLGDYYINNQIVNYFKFNIGHLSTQKFSSNVIEKVYKEPFITYNVILYSVSRTRSMKHRK